MELLTLRPNNPIEFAERLGENRLDNLPDVEGSVEIIVNPTGTTDGNPIVMVTFMVRDGNCFRRVQTVMTAKNFISSAIAISSYHPDLL